ncbi:minor capsid protein [Rhodococcus pyridinivorans]|uniref:minor capsid protein n=1 Tax=Rhodococcus pyridinivorans TaxID=103816 RepID=UPI003D7F84A2
MTTARAPATTAVEAAIAQHLATLGLARYTPNGVYTGTGPPAVFFGAMPDKPDDALVINTYNDDRSRDDTVPDYYIQIRGRCAGRDPRAVDQLMDSIFDAIHDAERQTWNGVPILLCRRTVRAPRDPDANGRWTRPDSYTLTVYPS